MAEIVDRREVIHEPVQYQSNNNGVLIAVLVIGIILLLLLLGGFGRRLFPVGGFGGTTIQVPRQVDVNVNK